VFGFDTTIKPGAVYQVCGCVSHRVSRHIFFVSTSFRTLVDHANRSLGPLRIDSEDYQFEIARWFPHLKVRRRLIQSDDALVMVLTNGRYCTAETVDILIDSLDCSYQLIIAGKIVAFEARTAWMMLTPRCCSLLVPRLGYGWLRLGIYRFVRISAIPVSQTTGHWLDLIHKPCELATTFVSQKYMNRGLNRFKPAQASSSHAAVAWKDCFFGCLQTPVLLVGFP
jgi:hypothetical protein